MNGRYERFRFIPCRKRDIISFLTGSDFPDDQLNKESFKHLCHLLESIFHFEFHRDLETLKDVYYPINPDLPTLDSSDPKEIDEANKTLIATLKKVLNDANYDQVTGDQIQEAYESSAAVGFSIDIDMNDYAFLEIYARGRRIDKIVRKKLFGLKKSEEEHLILERVLLTARMKEGVETSIPRGKTIIKLFKDVPLEDLEILFPNSRIIMSMRDKLLLAVPALAGGIPLLITKVIPALIVVFVVLGAYMGIRGSVEEDHLKQAIAALSAMGALGGYIIKQISKFKTRKFQFQKELSDNLYFRNLVNNAGVFHSLIDSAEEEEFKEAILAYYFISLSEDSLDEETLDLRVEKWLHEKLGVEIDYECPDALSKLERLGLLTRGDKGSLEVVPLDDALKKLDYQWDNYFTFNR